MRMRLALSAATVAVLLVGLAACSEAPKPVGQGGACALTSDCDVGLFCVPQNGGARICTGDVSSIMKPTQPPPSGDAGRDGGDGGDAGPTDGGGSDAPDDSSGPPVDGGGPPPDAATD